MYIDILGFKIYSGTKRSLIKEIDRYNKVNIVSGNPEVLYNGLNNKFLEENFKKDTSIIIPDGVGTVLASKILGRDLKEKIAGIECMDSIIKKCAEEGKSIFLLGAKEEVVFSCKQNILKDNTSLNIAGFRNGYFKEEEVPKIVEEIKKSDAYAIFIAMGSPKQEEFIYKYMNELPCKIFMGVGGSFDVYAGNVNRAPKWMINVGLEWLYRVSKEPWRIKRLKVIPKFLWKVLISRIKK